MPVRTVALQSKKNFSRNYVLYAQGGAFYCFLCTSFTRQPVLGRSFIDSDRSDNPGKHSVHDKILDKTIETGKGLKIKAKQLIQTCQPSRDLQLNIYRIYPRNMFTSLVCVNFANETRWYTNQEMCTVDSSEVYNRLYQKGHGDVKNKLRKNQQFVALFVEKRRVIGWHAKINE